MTRSRKDRNIGDGGRGSGGLGTSQGDNVPSGYLDHDIAQLTKLRSGPNEFLSRAIPGKSKVLVSPVKMLLGREGNYSGRGRFSSADNCHVLSRYLPVNGPRKIDTMQSCAYVSQFSEDGSLFVAAYQESEIRIYNVDNGWKVQKDIRAKSLRWTITDASLSPDQRLLVYSSMSPVVHIVNVTSAATESHANITEIHEGLDFAVDDDSEYSFGIFSVKFSTDGRELVAASSDDAIYVYDLQENRLALRIPSHKSHVNAVCFADESCNVIYSGSDDTLCKVWDRRCFVTKGEAAGVLNGHLEGITFIDSRGDGRYFISNGKDQAIKLWDIRKMSSNITGSIPVQYRNYDWDYRLMEYPTHARNLVHPNDQSLATYKGHSVLRTLIRCYFSPVYSTGQKYIYTGSSDNSVYIYDLVSGTQVAKLDYHEDPVRDCSWHPFYPILVSSSWDCTIAQWEFPGSGQPPPPPRPTRRRWRQYL
ncbi:LEC14B like [Actinidia chinensis var. chinensis]|uniref:LEC14B homolog n=1 Tax=Actinidia chinensis var. chinensis TaxID=1590841 RepID=A0A2R6P4H1_ACTCC|nr:LEC14B like [Actinidia chinensis var. chinensis]